MAYEAVESLQQTLRIILLRDDGVITTPVKHQIISIHDKAVVLQFNLKHFPDKETTREVANTTEEIIQYLFSPQYLSDFGSKNPTVRLSDQLGELAEELESTVGYMVDYCKINGGSGSPAVSVGSSSRSALKSQVEDLPVELLAIYTNGLRRLADKILSTGREVADDDPSDRPSISPLASKDVAAGFDDDLSDSAVAASSSRPAPTSKYFVADFAEDPSDSPSIYPPTSRDDVAGQEKFLLSVMDYFSNPILRRHFLPQVLQNHRRIGVSCHDLHLKDSTHSSCTTSIICSSQRGYKPKGSVDNFTSLRVLHVLRRNDHSYWELGQVFELIYLTYLASNIPDSIVPPAIAKLQNLQTLIIYRSGVRLPVEIWSLRQLRHLIAFSFHPLLLPEGASLSLENLQTLSMATNFVCSERMVKMIPNIKKLGICYSGEKFGAGYHLGNLIHLLRLEKLKLEVHSSFAPHLDNLVFPPSLIKLELSGGCISWNNMTIVGSLPKLQVLTLKNYACHGEQWETIDGEFGNLIHLLIDQSNLKCWTTDSSHFPRLQCLTLHRCPYLDEIPYEIGEIPTLQLIEKFMLSVPEHLSNLAVCFIVHIRCRALMRYLIRYSTDGRGREIKYSGWLCLLNSSLCRCLCRWILSFAGMCLDRAVVADVGGQMQWLSGSWLAAAGVYQRLSPYKCTSYHISI
ncbi:hypothetical protein AAHA92_23350 [Salvia divinorum]|uniref:Disease resistance R13L4/SHOC-2-like LRR domain-containing protein n=1 Tax=Salvia divinorum TaxID=28513 RepID=A0ABD1GSQ9_SALDI